EAPLQVQRPMERVERDDLRRRHLGRGGRDFVAGLESIRLLGIEAVSVANRLTRSVDLPDPGQLPYLFLILHKLGVRLAATVEERPPLDLLFAAMPLEQVSEEPPGLEIGLSHPLFGQERDTLHQPARQLRDALVAFGEAPFQL